MPEESLVKDGSVDFLGGQDASKTPNHIAENAFASGINVTTENAELGPRWGVEDIELHFPDEKYTMRNLQTRTYKDIFESGKFQAYIPYSIGAHFYQIVVISGIIYLINQKTFDVTIINAEDHSTFNEHAMRLNWSSAGKYLVIFDYPAYPMIIEGIAAHRADPSKFEVPISVMGAYNQNRLAVANAGNEWTAGDPAGNLLTPNAPITFEEIMTPGLPTFGQIFQLSTNYNNDAITAMGFLSTVDTSTGIGPLLVSTQNEIYSYQTQNPRVEWQAGKFGASFVSGLGVVGPQAITNVNSDVFFLSGKGELHTASMSRDAQGSWSKVAISGEVKNWLRYNDLSFARYAVVDQFNNKIFVTANPFRVKSIDTQRFPVGDVAFGGVVILDAANFATMGRTSPPVWDGLWTPTRPMDMINNDNRFFIIGKEGEINKIYELHPLSTLDRIRKKTRYVRSRIYTRSYDFKNPFQLKELKSLELNLDNIKGDFQMLVEYKPSHAPSFLHWRTFIHKAPYRVCTITSLQDSLCELAGHTFRDLNLGSPQETGCNSATDEVYDSVKRVQLRFTITGIDWTLAELMLNANMPKQSDRITPVCDETEVVKLYRECCNSDWLIPSENICQPTIT